MLKKIPCFIFNKPAILSVLLFILLLEFTFLSYTFLLSKSSFFLSSVLPSALVDITNNNRLSKNISALKPNLLLNHAAQSKAEDMAKKEYFSHTSPNGLSPWYWMLKEGYMFQVAGENLALNFYGSQEVVNAWMNSSTHKKNILNEKFSDIGIGVARGVYKGKEAIFIVQMFASPAHNPKTFSKNSDSKTFLEKTLIFTTSNVIQIFSNFNFFKATIVR